MNILAEIAKCYIHKIRLGCFNKEFQRKRHILKIAYMMDKHQNSGNKDDFKNFQRVKIVVYKVIIIVIKTASAFSKVKVEI